MEEGEPLAEEKIPSSIETKEADLTSQSDATVVVEKQELMTVREILTNVSINGITPLIIGFVVGAVWQYFSTDEMISILFPPQAGLLFLLLTSPLFYLLTVPRDWDEYGYYMIGLGAMFLFLFSLWFAGFGALFCGAYGITLLWFALMPNWTKRYAAPAKIGVMHVIAINIGSFLGSVLAYSQVA